MKEIKSDIIKKFVCGQYVVYIKEDKNCFESYIQNENYGVMSLMFGIHKKDIELKDFIDLVKINIKDYIETYKQDYEY